MMLCKKIDYVDLLNKIRKHIPKAHVRIFGYEYYVVDDGYGDYVGGYASTPEKAILNAYDTVKYN